MKTPILLKVLQSCHTKATPNFPNTRSRKGDKGFTLLEVLVTVLVLGILSSIAAPSWLAFINNQRVRTVNDRVLQSLRSAQSEAKRTKRDVTVTFNYAPNATPPIDPPKIAFYPALATGGDALDPVLDKDIIDKGGSKQKLNAGGEIKPGTIALLTNATTPGDADLPLNSIIFDYQGNVKKLPPDPSDPKKTRAFVVTISPAVGGGKKCVFVETILGGMRTDEGAACPPVP